MYVGNESLLSAHRISIPENLKQKAAEVQSKAHTVSYVAENESVLGFISFTDKIKENAKRSIQQLVNEGIEVIMLTGDNEHTAKAVADELGIKHFKANCHPEDKLNEVKTTTAGKNCCHDRRWDQRLSCPCPGQYRNCDGNRNRRCHGKRRNHFIEG